MYSKDYYESAEYNPELIGMNIFQKMSQYMPYMVFITRAPDFKLLYANRKVAEFLSLNLDDLQQMDGRILSMMHPEDMQALLETGQKIQFISDDQAIQLNVRLNTKDGKVVHLETSVSVYKRNPDGSPAEFFCISQDVTERVQLEARAHELQLISNAAEEESLKKYEATLQQAEINLQLGTWEWDINQGKVKWSDGFWQILEYPAHMRTKDWLPLEQYLSHVEPEKEMAVGKGIAYVENYDGTEPLEPQEIALTTYTGKTVHIVTYTRVLEWKDGKPTLAVGSTANITPMKDIQKSLETKVLELGKAYDEMEQFSYVASHDLQEPLRKISAFSERLKTKCGTTIEPDCALYLDRILDGTNRMRILIENLLTLSRTKRNTDFFRTTDLNEVLEEVLCDLEDKITAESAEVHYTKLPLIEAIPTQMHQLLLNLISNSLKFTKKDSNAVIHINSERLSQKQKDEYNLDMRLDYILITVQDNGIGFENNYAETIFAPFKRLHGRSEYEGTGIGLAICKKVAQNHSGTIWATSTPGNGAAFHVVLAANQPEA